MILRRTQITIAPEGEPIYAESAFTVSVDDEGGGEFVVLTSLEPACMAGVVRINPPEWPALRTAIDEMMAECRQND